MNDRLRGRLLLSVCQLSFLVSCGLVATAQVEPQQRSNETIAIPLPPDNAPCPEQQSEGEQVAEEQIDRSLLNWPTPTLGGKQLWTDYQWRAGWRIQLNALTNHWRLLDDRNIRRAWGSRAACDSELNKRVPDHSLPTHHAIFLMHGLGRTRSSMNGLAKYLSDGGFGTPICLEYASSRASISQHAAALRDVVDGLPSDTRIDFIGHSMGNIVVRHAISDWQKSNATTTLDRIEHVVMLGPPNQGASIARQLAKTGMFGWVAGEGALELGQKWHELEKNLATPPCPFGIIAGRLADTTIANPLVEGAGDFVVSVEETRLEGSADFLEVPVLHSFLMDSVEVQQAVGNFLKTDKFK